MKLEQTGELEETAATIVFATPFVASLVNAWPLGLVVFFIRVASQVCGLFLLLIRHLVFFFSSYRSFNSYYVFLKVRVTKFVAS